MPPVLWPFPHNWGDSFDVTHTYRTDIVTSRSGREQRRAVRQTPRKRVETSALIRADQRRELTRLLTAARNGDFLLHDPTRVSVFLGPLNASDTVLDLEDDPYWIYAGGYVVLTGFGRTETRLVADYYDGVIVFGDTGLYDWVGGSVSPALPGYLDEEFRTTARTNDVENIRVPFNVLPGEEPLPEPPAPAATFNDVELFLRKPNWANDLQSDWPWPRDVVDFGKGRIYRKSYVDHRTTIRQETFNLAGADNEDFLDVFRRARGQCGEIYKPTGSPDIVPAASWDLGDFFIQVAGTAFGESFGQDTTAPTEEDDGPVGTHRALVVWMKSGLIYYRRIAAITADESNDRSLIELDQPLASSASPSDVKMVSWLELSRFASDELTFRWLTNEVSEVQASFRSLEDRVIDP